jgi:hypothetical protein
VKSLKEKHGVAIMIKNDTHFINEFMKNQTLRVAIGKTLSEEKQIENEVVQRVVLTVTIFISGNDGTESKNPSK